MKKKTVFLCLLIIGSFLLFGLKSRAEELLVGFNDPECTAGETVTVQMWAQDGLDGIEIVLTYDTGMLEFLPGSSSGGTANGRISGGNGRIKIVDYFSEGKGKFLYQLVFRALKAGSTNVNTVKSESSISVDRVDVTDSVQFYWSEVTIKEATAATTTAAPPPPSSSTEPPAQTTTQPPAPTTTERPASSEKRLASLSFGSYSLSPSFNRDVYEYRLNIDSSTDNLQSVLRFSAVDEHATVYFWPYINSLPYGDTLFTVQVIAENNDNAYYHVTIHRPEPATTAPTTAKPTEPPTTPEPTTEPDTEPTTEPEETTTETEPDTDESREPGEVVLLSDSLALKVEPMPEYITAPDGYELAEWQDEYGSPFTCLVQKGVADPDHCIVYGAREETAEDGSTTVKQGFYLYDFKEKTLQRYGIMLPVPLESNTEETTPEETEPSTEETTPEETTAEPVTVPPVTTTVPVTVPQTQPMTSAPESTQSRQPAASGTLPWWFWAVIPALLALAAVFLLLFLLTRKRLNQQLEKAEILSPEEEEAFLAVNKGTLLAKAKAANPPADPYAIDPNQVEDLDEIFEGQGKKD